MKKIKSKKWAAGLLIVCCGLGGFLLYRAVSFPRHALEAAVAQIRSESIEPGRVHRFRLDRDLSSASLRPQGENESFGRGQARGSVWAEVTADGVLQIAFATRDWGHAGMSGYVYSDKPVISADIDELGPEWTLGRRISEHWWKIIYDLG